MRLLPSYRPTDKKVQQNSLSEGRFSAVEETMIYILSFQIMGHMDVIPIISDGFNIYFPIMIVLLCIGTYFSLGSRILHFLGINQFIGEDDLTQELIDEGRELVNRGKEITR